MRSRRVERLLKLIQALQSGRPMTVEQLAEAAGVSRRTIFRDLELLSRAGIHYAFDRGTQRYTAERMTLLPPVTLTHAEALALMTMLRLALRHPATTNPEGAASAVLKIESMLPQALRDYVGTALNETEVRHDPASHPDGADTPMRALRVALAQRRKIRIRYDSYYDGTVIETDLCPYRLAYVHRGWYVIGYSESVREIRMFKLERVLNVRLLEERYRIDRRFSLDDYFGNAWLMIRGAERYHVKVRFLPKVAGNVDEIAWHKTQRTQFQEDGSLLFEVDVDGIDEIVWWILGYGDQAEVLEPASLRDRIAQHARNLVARYEPRGALAPEQA